VGRALAELDIRWIPAHSPQATGRIERLWGTLQDRLVSELRRARAVSRDKANAVLAAFLPRYNRRFITPPAHPAPAYRPLPAELAIDHVCCFKYERTVANDNTVRLEEHLIQILRRLSGASPHHPLPHAHADTARDPRAAGAVATHTPDPRAPSGQRVDPPARTPALDAGAGPSLASIRAHGTAKESTQRGRSVMFVEQIR
jgi:hypothetical protein